MDKPHLFGSNEQLMCEMFVIVMLNIARKRKTCSFGDFVLYYIHTNRTLVKELLCHIDSKTYLIDIGNNFNPTLS